MTQATLVHQVSLGNIRVSVATSRRPLRNMLTIERRASGSTGGWYPAATYPPEEAADLIGAVNMAVAWIKREADNPVRGKAAANADKTSDGDGESDGDPERADPTQTTEASSAKDDPVPGAVSPANDSAPDATPPFVPSAADRAPQMNRESPCRMRRSPTASPDGAASEDTPRCDPVRSRTKSKKPPASRSAALARRTQSAKPSRSR